MSPTLRTACTLLLAIACTLLLTALPAHAGDYTAGLHLATWHDGSTYQSGTPSTTCRREVVLPNGTRGCGEWAPTVERYRADTVGVYVRHNPSGWQGGVLRNSFGRTSVYLAYTLHSADGRFALAVGGITGYQGEPVRPLLVPSMRLPLPGLVQTSARLSLLPAKPGNREGKHAAGVHLSLEREF
jgi:hypothetical protein